MQQAAKRKQRPTSAAVVSRRMHPLQCMLCIFIGSALLLTLIVVVMGIVRSMSLSSSDDDDNYGGHKNYYSDDEDSRRHHHNKRRPTNEDQTVPAELNTLEALENVVDQQTLTDQSGWLPHLDRKRASLGAANPFVSAERKIEGRPKHRLDLRSYKHKVSHDFYYLGAHPHPHDPNVELHSYAFVHFIENEKQPPKHLAHVERTEKHKHFNRTQENATLKHRQEEVVKCGAPIAKGARWKTSKGYFMHPTNSGGAMSSEKIIEQSEAAMDSWRCVFRDIHLEPLGPLLGVVFDDDMDENGIDFRKPTGENRIAFGRLYLADGNEDNTLAITVSHGVFSGPVDQRYLAEYSTVFNDKYTFADCAEVDSHCKRKGYLDFQSILTHELGHALGMDDLYSEECRPTTLFWAAQPGEINKRTLEEQDKLSIVAHYTQ